MTQPIEIRMFYTFCTGEDPVRQVSHADVLVYDKVVRRYLNNDGLGSALDRANAYVSGYLEALDSVSAQYTFTLNMVAETEAN